MDATISREEFALRFGQCRRRIFGYVRALVPCRADAEEVFQETCVVLWREFPSFRPEADFLPWALAIAFNQVRSYRHRCRRTPALFSDELLEQLEAEQRRMQDEIDQRADALDGCVQQLSATDRDLLSRYYREDTTAARVAQALGRPVNTVYKALARIRRVLSDCVQRRLNQASRGTP
jgi:RNA polymerase sigma-70 factor (ECF subfamily)